MVSGLLGLAIKIKSRAEGGGWRCECAELHACCSGNVLWFMVYVFYGRYLLAIFFGRELLTISLSGYN
jgi:hypothetical protein